VGNGAAYGGAIIIRQSSIGTVKFTGNIFYGNTGNGNPIWHKSGASTGATSSYNVAANVTTGNGNWSFTGTGDYSTMLATWLNMTTFIPTDLGLTPTALNRVPAGIAGFPTTDFYGQTRIFPNGTEGTAGAISGAGIEYTVRYHKNNAVATGTMADSTHFYGTASRLRKNTFALTGHTFAGWSLASGGTSVDDNIGISGKLTDSVYVTSLSTTSDTVHLYAVWTANKWYVKYYANSVQGVTGTPPAVQTRTYNETDSTNLNDGAGLFTKTGHAYAAWHSAEDTIAGTRYTATQKVNNNLYTGVSPYDTLRLYAVMRPNKYSVIYNKNAPSKTSGGTWLSSITGDVPSAGTHIYSAGNNAIAANPNTLALPGFTLLGWSVKSDTTKAEWAIASGSTNAGSLTTGTSSVNVYAIWQRNHYTLYFNGNKGLPAMTNNPRVAYDSAIGTLSAPSRGGWNFSGWHTDSVGGSQWQDNEIYPTVGNDTLYARWSTNNFTVSFFYNNNGSDWSKYKDTSVTSGQKVKNYTPARRGYKFNGWYAARIADGNCGGSTAFDFAGTGILAGDSLYACWSAGSYRVTFSKSGGTGGADSVRATYDAAMPNRGYTAGALGDLGAASAPSRTGYRFKGYYDRSNTRYYTAAMASDHNWNQARDTTLAAQWDTNTYYVRYYANGGTGTTALSEHKYDRAKQLTSVSALNFRRTGYDFKGWSLDADAYSVATRYLDAQSVTNLDGRSVHLDTVNLYAHWTSKTYRIRLYANAAGLKFSNDKDTIPHFVKFDSAINRLSALPAIARNGYSFKNYWTESSGGGKIYTGDSIYRDILLDSLWYQWKPDTFNLRLVYDNGDTYNPDTTIRVVFDSTLRALGVLPSNAARSFKTGYTFGSWVEPRSALEWTSTRLYQPNPARDTVLKASWNANIYKVYLNRNIPPTGEAILLADTVQVTYNSAMSNLHSAGYSGFVIPARPGYKFAGWNTSSDGTGAPKDSSNLYNYLARNDTLYAKWEPKSYLVTFDVAGGAEVLPNTRSVLYGDTIRYLPATTRTGYHCDTFWHAVHPAEAVGNKYKFGSRDSIFRFTDTLKLRVQWTPDTFRLTLDGNGGAFVTAGGDTSFRVTYDSTLYASHGQRNLPRPVRPGYTFLRYDTQASGSMGTSYSDNSVYRFTGNTTLYARWQVKQYVITFDAHDGSIPTQAFRSIPYGDTIRNLPMPTRTGYHCDTFWYNKDVTDAKYRIGANFGRSDSVFHYSNIDTLKLEVHWVADTFRLRLYGNEGAFVTAGGDTSFCVTYDSTLYGSLGRALPVPVREGYLFRGYNTRSTGSGARVDSSYLYKFTRDTSLWAQWVPDTFLITFDANCGGAASDPASIRVPYGQAIGTLPSLSRTNYGLLGWFTTAAGNPPADSIRYTHDTIYRWDYDRTLFARWEANAFTVTYDLRNGISYPESVKADDFNAPDDPAWTGHTFLHWVTKPDGSVAYPTDPASTDTTMWIFGTSSPSILNSDTTLYAVWQTTLYDLRMDGNGGTFANSLGYDTIYNIPYGDTVGNVSDKIKSGNFPVRMGTFFEGYKTSAGFPFDSTSVYDFAYDTTVYAQWTANTYRISFAPVYPPYYDRDIYNPGEIYAAYGLPLSASGTLPVLTDMPGAYTFAGWWHPDTSVAAGKLYENDTVFDKAYPVRLGAGKTPTDAP
jgi:uncharacterized repeat protein (TIGR02543 family)